MKKYFVMAVLCTALCSNSFAQVSFNHSLGLGVFVNSGGGGYAAVYSPRLNFLSLSDNATISIGTHFGLGFAGSVSSEEGSSASIILDIPIVAELNLGHACNPDNDNAVGFYVGGGFGYNSMASSDEDGTSSSSTSGIVLNGGLRTNALLGRSLDLRVSYLIGLSGSSGVFGITLAYTFGMEK